jgi:hypothetical protein
MSPGRFGKVFGQFESCREFYPLAARTIATIPSISESGSDGHASMINFNRGWSSVDGCLSVSVELPPVPTLLANLLFFDGILSSTISN